MSERANVVLPGKVEQVIQPPVAGEPEKAQIAVEGADTLYREIRIENFFTDEKGHKVRLKGGAEVEVKGEGDMVDTPPGKNKRSGLSASQVSQRGSLAGQADVTRRISS